MEEDYNRDFSEAFEMREKIKFSITPHQCPVCKKKRGRGRIYVGGRKTIYCPDCKTESPV